jgi:O-antigen/teichoic acid export membrane protein
MATPSSRIDGGGGEARLGSRRRVQNLLGSRSSESLHLIVQVASGLVGTQAATSVLGFFFWMLAARMYPTQEVGIAAAALSAMLFLGTVGMLGLGMLLIDHLPHESFEQRRRMTRSAFAVACGVGFVLGAGFAAAVGWFDVEISALGASTGTILLFALGIALTSGTQVLDQAVLVRRGGGLQFERNVTASLVKLALLPVFAWTLTRTGMTIYGSWVVAAFVSLLYLLARTRGSGPFSGRPMFDFGSLRSLGRAALSHHALNLGLQIPAMVLPLLVAVLISAEANAFFTTAWLLSVFVFAASYAVSVAIFVAVKGDVSELLRRSRQTIPLGLVIAIGANVGLIFVGPLLLSAFGPDYVSNGVAPLHILTLAALPLVLKDHFVALRRVQGRTRAAAVTVIAWSSVEMLAAGIGAVLGGLIGLCIAWVVVVTAEGLALGIPILKDLVAHRAPETGRDTGAGEAGYPEFPPGR